MGETVTVFTRHPGGWAEEYEGVLCGSDAVSVGLDTGGKLLVIPWSSIYLIRGDKKGADDADA